MRLPWIARFSCLLALLSLPVGCGGDRHGGGGGGGEGEGEGGGEGEGEGSGEGEGEGSGEGEGEGEGSGEGEGEGELTVTVAQVQDAGATGHPAEGSAILLRQVVVTAGPGGGGSFHVQDAGGGPNSGLYAYNPHSALDVSALSPGAIVELAGIYREYTPTGETASFSEIELTRVQPLGTTAEPVANPVEPSDLVEERGEPWEGALVQLPAVEVIAPPAGAVAGLTYITGGIPLSRTYFTFRGTVGQQLLFVRAVAMKVSGKFQLAPRQAEDVGGLSSEVPLVTPADLQDPTSAHHPAAGSEVRLTGLVVTGGPTTDGKSFHVSTPFGGPRSGLYVYSQGGSALAGMEQVRRGAVLELQGIYDEFPHGDPTTVTELLVRQITLLQPSAAEPPPVEVDCTSLGQDLTLLATLEGALVQATNCSATATPDAGHGQMMLEGGLMTDDIYYSRPLTAGSYFASITGVVHFLFGKYVLLPRGPADFSLSPAP